jgi:hypothetical protein
MSDLRIEKRRTPATLTLSTGATVDGHFFLWGGAPTHTGPERVIDLLNGETGFFPFELDARGAEPAHTALYNRSHIVLVQLPAHDAAMEGDPSYSVAVQRPVTVQLSTGVRLSGVVHVVTPASRNRLSDYAGLREMFRALETVDRTVIVNMTYIITLIET